MRGLYTLFIACGPTCRYGTYMLYTCFIKDFNLMPSVSDPAPDPMPFTAVCLRPKTRLVFGGNVVEGQL